MVPTLCDSICRKAPTNDEEHVACPGQRKEAFPSLVWGCAGMRWIVGTTQQHGTNRLGIWCSSQAVHKQLNRLPDSWGVISLSFYKLKIAWSANWSLHWSPFQDMKDERIREEEARKEAQRRIRSVLALLSAIRGVSEKFVSARAHWKVSRSTFTMAESRCHPNSWIRTSQLFCRSWRPFLCITPLFPEDFVDCTGKSH